MGDIGGPPIAVSAYDKQYLTTGQQAAIQAATDYGNSTGDWAKAHTDAEAVRASSGYSGGRYGDSYSAYDSTPESRTISTPSAASSTDYLKDMYAAQTESQLAALKSAYADNTADLQSAAAAIPQTYYTAKNAAASQNEIAKQAFNEYADARGLNTGTSGQAALANSSALQSNLSNINTEQANALSNNTLQQNKLASEYSAAIAAAQASGGSSLASALYQEYTRQAEATTTAQENALAQENWEKEYQLSTQQNTQSVDSENKQYAYNLATTMLSAGVMPDSSTLAAAGISTADASAMQKATLAAAAASASKSTASTYKATAAKKRTSSKKSTTSSNKLSSASATVPTLTTYNSATSYLTSKGKSSAGLMTQSEFIRHKNSGNSVYAAYPTYADYLSSYVDYAIKG